MSIIIENEYEGEINIPYEKIAHEVIDAAIDRVLMQKSDLIGGTV